MWRKGAARSHWTSAWRCSATRSAKCHQARWRVEWLLEILDRLERVLRRHLDRVPVEHRQTIEREVLGLVHMARAAAPRELHHAAWLQGGDETALARAPQEARRGP